MKKKIKSLITIIALSSLISVGVLAGGYTQTIEVMLNEIQVRVNGEYMSGDNILYKGTTYVPLRAAGEILNKEVGWDENTRTASIEDKPSSASDRGFPVPKGLPEEANLIKSIPEYKYHEFIYDVELDSGARIGRLIISDTKSKEPHITLSGVDKNGRLFIRGRHLSEAQLDNMLLSGEEWPETFTKEDEDIAYEVMKIFFEAYGYEDSGYESFQHFTR